MQSSFAQEAVRVEWRPQQLKLAHSPDSDDAFMFYALATKKVQTGNLKFEHVLADIETLNQEALKGTYEITAISFHAYAFVAKEYLLLPCGASFGDGYGPVVVARETPGSNGLRGKRVAVPGRMTTAYLALKIYEPEIEPLFAPFDRILEIVASGQSDAGVLIHEGQLTYAREGMEKILDLGEWWQRETNLPLPLGGNIVRRSLEPQSLQQVARLMRESILYSLDHREEALAYALQFARGLDASTADRFVAMYVNDWTLGYGERGREAVQTLLDRGFRTGLLPRRVKVEFVES